MRSANAAWPPVVNSARTAGSCVVWSTVGSAPAMSASVSAGSPPSANQPSDLPASARTTRPPGDRLARASASALVSAAAAPASGPPVTLGSAGAGAPSVPRTLRSQSKKATCPRCASAVTASRSAAGAVTVRPPGDDTDTRASSTPAAARRSRITCAVRSAAAAPDGSRRKGIWTPSPAGWTGRSSPRFAGQASTSAIAMSANAAAAATAGSGRSARFTRTERRSRRVLAPARRSSCRSLSM